MAAASAIVPSGQPDIQPQSASLMTVIERLSSNPNVDIEKIQRLLEMQERWEVNKDKAALRAALAEFKHNPPAIIKNRVAQIRDNFSYNYADLEAVTSAIESELAAKGIIFAWPQKEAENGFITVTCVLRLGMYDEEGVSMSAPPDQSGGKNSIQAKASTVSYLRRYTLLGAVGMAAGMPDTDGNAAPRLEGYADAMALIEKAATHEELKGFYQSAVRCARKAGDKASEKDFTEAKDKRKAELEAIQ